MYVLDLVLGIVDGDLVPGFWSLVGKTQNQIILKLHWVGLHSSSTTYHWWHWPSCLAFLVHGFPICRMEGNNNNFHLLGINKWECLELSSAHCKHWENVSYRHYCCSGAKGMLRCMARGVMGSGKASLRKEHLSWGLQGEQERARWRERGA